MGNVFFGFKNYVKSDYNNVVLSGGDWLNLDNVKNSDLHEVATSNGITLASTMINVDLGALVDVRCFAIPNNVITFNPSRLAKHRIRAGNKAKWSGAAVNGANASGTASISLKNNNAASLIISSGDVLSIQATLPSGEKVWNKYSATVTINIASNSNALLSVTPALVRPCANNDVVECNIGDFTSPLYDTGWIDIIQAIYPFGELPWGHQLWWDGKPSDEELLKLPFPVIKFFDAILCRYWKYEVDDLGNREWNKPNLTIPYLFIGNGYQPTLNMGYQGTEQSFVTQTTQQVTIGGRRIEGAEPIARTCAVNIPAVNTKEALTQGFDLQWLGGISNELMFIFNPDDTELLHRRSFLAKLEKLNPLRYPFFNANDMIFEVIEVL